MYTVKKKGRGDFRQRLLRPAPDEKIGSSGKLNHPPTDSSEDPGNSPVIAPMLELTYDSHGSNWSFTGIILSKSSL
jgi:hypothetical protein